MLYCRQSGPFFSARALCRATIFWGIIGTSAFWRDAMTLTLTPDTEARVRSIAELSEQDPEDALIALLNQALTEAEVETEMLAELRASVKDHDAGRSMTIEEYRVKALARRHARDAKNAPQVEIATRTKNSGRCTPSALPIGLPIRSRRNIN